MSETYERPLCPTCKTVRLVPHPDDEAESLCPACGYREWEPLDQRVVEWNAEQTKHLRKRLAEVEEHWEEPKQ